MKTVLAAALAALLTSILVTPLVVRYFRRHGLGQEIRGDGPQQHLVKRGTPTMGGVIVIIAVLLGYFGSHVIYSRAVTASAMLALWLMVGLGLVGFLDDFLKIRNARSLGLSARWKLAGQAVVAVSFAILSLNFPDNRGVTPASPAISFLRDLNWAHLPLVFAVVWIVFIIAAFSNGTNLTDGLDGLLTGAATMVFLAYAIVNVWQMQQWCGRLSSAGPKCYEVRNPLDLAILAIAIAGSLFGFLWWNARPAKIFIGDTGSLAIGGGVAAMAIFTRTELLGVVLGALFVVETLSVSLQVGYFKLTHGKRLFKMAPIHHHFEMLGWDEVTVVIRFWLLAGLAVVFGTSLFYAEWVVGQ